MDVRDAMTTEVVTVTRETPLKEVARILVDRRISGVPVVDDERRVLGVVSEADFLAKEVDPRSGRRSPLGWLLTARHHDADRARVEAVTAGDAMTSPAITIEAGRRLAEAADMMARSSINRLPVVEDGRLVGIVSRADVVRAFVRTDADLEQSVVHALRAVDGLHVEGVTNGVVTLTGTVSSHAVAEVLRRLVLRVEGIVAVDDRAVNWLVDEREVTTIGSES